NLEKMGYTVLYVSPRADGIMYSKDISDLVDEETILVSIMHVNNETGLRLPIEQISKEVKQKNIKTIVHVDGVQGFTKLPVQLPSNGSIDLYSFSGHKIHALKGAGGLYIKNRTKITPLFFGGGQENGIRVGTQNTVGIAALGVAAGEGYSSLLKNLQHYKVLREYLVMKLRGIDCVQINSNDCCVDYIVNFSVVSVKSEIMLHFLEEQGIYVSSGSACSSRDKNKKSSVLMAVNLSADVVDSAIRVSFCEENTKEEIDMLIKQIEIAVLRFAKNRR
ncbi:MAG: aminotransferase class V-fold PLP-dependent enzyme, partial [Niameybacter sp.]